MSRPVDLTAPPGFRIHSVTKPGKAKRHHKVGRIQDRSDRAPAHSAGTSHSGGRAPGQH